MRTKIFILVVLFCSILFVVQGGAELLSSAALTSAERFTAAVDREDYQAAYSIASPILRLKNKQEQWVDEVGQSFQLLGKAKERELMVVRSRDSYPGLPDGNYLIVSYQTETEYKAKAVEVLLLKEQDESWQVCRYTIR